MKIKAYQIYFDPQQVAGLDPAFVPYDNSGSPEKDEREFYVFQKEYHEGHIRPDEWTGFLSWKFQAKSGIRGSDFLKYCHANPGHDVYFVNPFPIKVCLGNVWKQGN